MADDLVVHCELADSVDLRAGLEAAYIEHFEVDADRTLVISQSAILMVVATDGDATAAHAFDVELWEPPIHNHDLNPTEILTDLTEEFTTALPMTRRPE
ncbi:hypothetical protein J2752_002572 [Halarchaeum rubridurum]|nr:hypothetical protein [Halarchaeum rubridurum]MBP1955643.1 hypothetical protein [Halarchaeum rubridurum]